jgi:hypothetical protein
MFCVVLKWMMLWFWAISRLRKDFRCRVFEVFRVSNLKNRKDSCGCMVYTGPLTRRNAPILSHVIKEQVDQKKECWARKQKDGKDGSERKGGFAPSLVNGRREGFGRGMAFANHAHVIEIKADFTCPKTWRNTVYAQKKEYRWRAAPTAAAI